MLIFIGPTASDKTTYMKALCSRIEKSRVEVYVMTGKEFLTFNLWM